MLVQMYFSYFVNGFSILWSTALADSTASVIPAALNPLRMISFGRKGNHITQISNGHALLSTHQGSKILGCLQVVSPFGVA